MYSIVLLTILITVFILEVLRRITTGKTIFLSDDEIFLIVILVPLMALLIAKGIIS